MIFDEELQKGIKKRCIPPPLTVCFPSNASYDTVLQKGKECFFPYENSATASFCLADSGGTPYKVAHESDWVLSDFVQTTGQPPSKLRLYILCKHKVNSPLFYSRVGRLYIRMVYIIIFSNRTQNQI